MAGTVEVDGAFLGVDEGEKPGAGERAADKVGAGDGGAVGHGEADFGALAAHDLQVIRQLDDDIGGHAGRRDGAGTGEPGEGIALRGGPDIGHFGGGAGKAQRGFLAVQDAAPAVFALGRRGYFAQQARGGAGHVGGGPGGNAQVFAEAPALGGILHAPGTAGDERERGQAVLVAARGG